MEQNTYYRLLQATQAEIPHGRLDVLQKTLDELNAFTVNSLFTAHLASWMVENSELRDPRIVLAANLIASPDWRDVGNGVLQSLTPAEVYKAIRYLKGTTEPIKVREGKKTRIEQVKMGIGKNLPHSTKTALKAYLRDKDREIDGVVRAAQWGALRGIYALAQIKPFPNAKELWDNAPTHGAAYWLRLLPTMDVDAQAETILEHKLPYTLVVGSLKQLTAPVILALVKTMTVNQLQHNLASLEKRGALDVPEIREEIEAKLTSNKKASLRQNVAAKAIRNEKVKETLAQAEEQQISLRGEIKVPVALFIDKSGSQETSIELSKKLLPYLVSASKAGLRVWAFDSSAFPIDLPTGATANRARAALDNLTGMGSTRICSAIDALTRSGFTAEMLIVLSDEQTEHSSHIVRSLEEYTGARKVFPSVVIARTPAGQSASQWSEVRTAAEVSGLSVDAFDVTKADTYAVGQILRLATSGGKIGIVQKILEYPLAEAKK